MENIGQVFEALMVISFGFAWPSSILKSWRAGTAKGKSILFLCIIFSGYVFGITWKLIENNFQYPTYFYFLNLVMVGIDIALYIRNRGLDKKRA